MIIGILVLLQKLHMVIAYMGRACFKGVRHTQEMAHRSPVLLMPLSMPIICFRMTAFDVVTHIKRSFYLGVSHTAS